MWNPTAINQRIQIAKDNLKVNSLSFDSKLKQILADFG